MVRRKVTRRRRAYTATDRRLLLTGFTFGLDCSFTTSPTVGDPVALDMDAIRFAWHDDGLRDELLPDYIQANPGRRPWSWWALEAPEPQRRVLRGHDGYADSDAPAFVRESLSFGVIHVFGSKEYHDPPVVETEAAYLDRHNLLTDAERVALGFSFPREDVYCKTLPGYVTEQPEPWEEKEIMA